MRHQEQCLSFELSPTSYDQYDLSARLLDKTAFKTKRFCRIMVLLMGDHVHVHKSTAEQGLFQVISANAGENLPLALICTHIQFMTLDGKIMTVR